LAGEQKGFVQSHIEEGVIGAGEDKSPWFHVDGQWTVVCGQWLQESLLIKVLIIFS